MSEPSAGMLEVKPPGTGCAILDGAAELLFVREFGAAMTAYGDYADITTDKLLAELAAESASERHTG